MIYGLAILFLWTISFFFAGIEAGLLSIDPVRLRHHVKQRRPAALRLDRLVKRPERLLITVLLVTNLANILGLLLLTKLLVERFGVAGFLWSIVIALPIYLFVLSAADIAFRVPISRSSPRSGMLTGSQSALAVLESVSARGASLSASRERIGALFMPRGMKRSPSRLSAKALTSTERAMFTTCVPSEGRCRFDGARLIAVRSGPIPVSKPALAPLNVDRSPVFSTHCDEVESDVLDIVDKARRIAANNTRRSYQRRRTPYRIIQRLAARLFRRRADSQKNSSIVTGEDIQPAGAERLNDVRPPIVKLYDSIPASPFRTPGRYCLAARRGPRSPGDTAPALAHWRASSMPHLAFHPQFQFGSSRGKARWFAAMGRWPDNDLSLPDPSPPRNDSPDQDTHAQ